MIGIIDSGIGGKGIEREICKLIPNVKIIYFADTKNFPYGEKKTKELNLILEKNIKFLIKKGAKIIVLACNSATVSSVKYLRGKFNIPIVGVEPAIKVASEVSKTKSIALFATPITIKSSQTNNLIKKYCKGIKVYKIAFKNLAEEIEAKNIDQAVSSIKKVWIKYQNKNIDTIVLGCTHYTLIKKEIQKIVGAAQTPFRGLNSVRRRALPGGPSIKILDSNKAVARQVKKIHDLEIV